MSPVIEVRNLTVYYYTKRGVVRAVEDVSFSGDRGDLIAIVGESGSGKSTLAYSLLKLVPPPGRIVRGDVIIDGVNVLKLEGEELRKARGFLISMVFQDPFTTLDPLRKVGDQIIDVLVDHGVDGNTALERARELVKAVGLQPEILNRYPHQLSGGQRQRISIAMAIALNPKVLVADEPTTALDVIVQKQILDLIDSTRSGGTTVILITHDIALAAERATKIIVMYAGKIVEMGNKQDVLMSPLHPYTKGLISSVPTLKTETWPKSIPGFPPNLLNPPSGCRFHPRCLFATDICKKEEPLLIEVKRGHFVSCWLYGGKR